MTLSTNDLDEDRRLPTIFFFGIYQDTKRPYYGNVRIINK